MTMRSLLGPRFQLEFARDRTSPTPLSWLSLGIGTLALVLAICDLAPRWAQRQQLRLEREQLLAQLDSLEGMDRAGSAPSADPAALAHARALLAELNRPWPQLFEQFESVRVPGVHLVQIGVDSRFRTVQVLAEAARLDEVLSFSQKLADRGPLRAVRLTHHEWHAAPVGKIVAASLTADLAAETRMPAGAP